MIAEIAQRVILNEVKNPRIPVRATQVSAALRGEMRGFFGFAFRMTALDYVGIT
jgi:hypothetical protein